MVRLLHHFYLISYFQKFTDTGELYLHHRNIYDSIIRERIANFPLDLGFIVSMVSIEMAANIGLGWRFSYINYFPTVEGGIARILSFDWMATRSMCSSCCMLLRDFFTDPVRAGGYVIDGPKYALVARFLLDCFIEPRPERKFEQGVFVFYVINGMLTQLIQVFRHLRSLSTFQWD